MKKIFLLSVIFLLNIKVLAQIPDNTLFLIVNKEQDSLRFTTKPNYSLIEFSTYQGTEPDAWTLYLMNVNNNKKDIKINLFNYLLPQEMIKDYIQKGNVITFKQFKKKINPLDYDALNKIIESRSYQYTCMVKGKKESHKRYNIFLIFDTDLDKRFVECYQLRAGLGYRYSWE